MAKISFYEIASVLVEHNGLTNSKATAFVKTLFDIIQERLPIDQQVKIKGLGTFKIVLVEDRESINVNTGERILIEGHSKITFTPDTAMKELINKPFSQFETVILKDGIAFEEPKVNEEKTVEKVAAKDIELDVLLDTIAEPIDSVVEDYIPAAEDYIPVEEIAAPIEEVVVPVEEDIVVPPVVKEETPVNEDSTMINFIPSVETAPEPVVDIPETSIDEQEDVELEDTEEYEESSSRIKSILLHILYVVVIAALSAYGGYWYGVNHQQKTISELNLTENAVEPEIENVIIEDTVTTDTIKSQIVAEKGVTTANEKHTDKESVKPVQPVAEPASAIKSESADFDSGKYTAMDARVRTGAYLIVGEDRTITARKGETLSKLSKRVLGEGMECYVEVFNGISANTELQEGQKIKIPKLKLKKKKTNTPQPNTPQP